MMRSKTTLAVILIAVAAGILALIYMKDKGSLPSQAVSKLHTVAAGLGMEKGAQLSDKKGACQLDNKDLSKLPELAKCDAMVTYRLTPGSLQTRLQHSGWQKTADKPVTYKKNVDYPICLVFGQRSTLAVVDISSGPSCKL